MRAVAYLRVSSTSQIDGYSLDAQERLFMESCRSHGWQSVRVYREEGRSAHSDSVNKRPEMRQLLRDAVKGDFDLVVVHTPAPLVLVVLSLATPHEPLLRT